MIRHVWMLAVCVLPLVLVLSLSSMGIGSNGFFALLLVGCVAMHLWMVKGLDHRHNGKGDRNE